MTNVISNTLTYAALEAAFHALHRMIGLRVREIPLSGDARSLLIGELGNPNLPSIALATGVHGDEPAGPWAVLSMLANGSLDGRFSYRVWPCMNPSGYAAGTRYSADGVDINRSFSRGGSTPEARAIIGDNHGHHFTLSIDLHEDYDADGFYCYVAGSNAEELGRAVTRAIEEAGFPLQELAGFDFAEPGETSATRRCDHGVVVRGPDEPDSFDHEGLCYNLYMLQTSAANIVTLESPRRLAWSDRIAMHRVAVVAAVDYLAAALSQGI